MEDLIKVIAERDELRAEVAGLKDYIHISNRPTEAQARTEKLLSEAHEEIIKINKELIAEVERLSVTIDTLTKHLASMRMSHNAQAHNFRNSNVKLIEAEREVAHLKAMLSGQMDAALDDEMGAK